VSVPLAAGELARAAATLDRRAFLRLAAVSMAAGLLPSGCGNLPPALVPSSGRKLAVLSPRAYATFTAVALRVVGPRGAELIETRAVDVGAAADAWLARTPALATPITQALAVIEFGVWPLVSKLRPFTSLDGGAQDAVLDDLMRSRLDLKGAMFQGLRALSLLSFYSSPTSRALTGYPGPFGNERVAITAGMVGT
jgi:hypothetical protein